MCNSGLVVIDEGRYTTSLFSAQRVSAGELHALGDDHMMNVPFSIFTSSP